MATADFQALQKDLTKFIEVSKSLGGNVATSADAFVKAIDEERKFLEHAVKTKKPSDDDFQKLLTPISTEMGKVGEIKEKNRSDKNFNHLSALAEASSALGWVCVDKTPAPFTKEATASVQFWTNKILKDFKGKDDNQVAWANDLVKFLQDLEKYIRQYHTTGVAWGSGGSATTASAATSAGSSGSGPVEDFKHVTDHLGAFVTASKAIGGLLEQQANLFADAVKEEQKLIEHAAKTKAKPSPDAVQKLLTPISDLMAKITDIKDKNRKDPLFDHLSAVAEGSSTLGWVAVDGTPAPFAKEGANSAVFYTNKILKAYRGKDEKHVEWVNLLNAFLGSFEPYVKQHHLTGLSWGCGGGGTHTASAPVHAASGGNSVGDFEALVDEHLSIYKETSKKLGGPVDEQAGLFLKAVDLEKALLNKVSSQKKPSDGELQKLLQPISELMTKVAELKDKNRGHTHFNHLNTVAEGVQVLGWVCVEPTPGPYAKDLIAGSEFWSNKILKDFKGKDQLHVDWVKGFNGFLKALPPYIQQHHTTGLSWKK